MNTEKKSLQDYMADTVETLKAEGMTEVSYAPGKYFKVIYGEDWIIPYGVNKTEVFLKKAAGLTDEDFETMDEDTLWRLRDGLDKTLAPHNDYVQQPDGSYVVTLRYPPKDGIPIDTIEVYPLSGREVLTSESDEFEVIFNSAKTRMHKLAVRTRTNVEVIEKLSWSDIATCTGLFR